jgi:tetratricopeptide (TPR) repeat protein
MSPSNRRPAFLFTVLLLLGMSGLAIAGCSAPSEEAIAAGNTAFAAGDFASAEAWYQAAIEEDADSAAAWINTGLARLRAEQFEEAIEAFRRGAAKARGPLAARAFFDLGAASLLGGDVETAIEAFREALRLDPTDEDARHDLELAMAVRNQQQDSQESESQEQSEEDQEGGEQQEGQEGQEGDGQEQQSEDGQEGQEGQEGQSEEDPSGGSQQEGEPQAGEEEGEGSEAEQGEESDPGEGAQADSGGEASEEEGELTEEQAAALQEALEGMTPAQARRLLRALGGDSRSLQQVLQMRLPANGQRPDKDW